MIATSYLEQVESAKTPGDLFTDADKARSTYRRLARMLHPDRNPDDIRATSAMARLSELWAQYNGRTTTPTTAATVYSTKRRDYVLGNLVRRGPISNIYTVLYEDSHGELKMPRDPAHNEMIVTEIKALKTLNEDVPGRYRMFHPTTVDSFSHRDGASGKTRRALITEPYDGFVTLREVREAYPKGIDPRHVAWIGRRLWIAIDTAHVAGLVHAAVFPEHVLIHPAMHGVVLADWGYSREKGEKLTSAMPRYLKDGWYGTNYDKPLDHRLDVRQAAYTLDSLLGVQEARPFRAFFNGCRVASTPTAGELYEEFEELLTRVYGKRKYVPFSMPTGWSRSL